AAFGAAVLALQRLADRRTPSRPQRTPVDGELEHALDEREGAGVWTLVSTSAGGVNELRARRSG
ncbi:MAG TPA: hypothetical protein VGJ32_05140, partial [Solirubrobacteraceae bacterium]